MGCLITKPFHYHLTVIEKKKVLDFRHQQIAFLKLKSYIRLSYQKTTFFEGHFEHVRRALLER